MLDYGLERSADVLARAFADYFVQIPFSVPMLLSFVRADSVDLSASRIFVRDGVAVGGAWIARRGWNCRLGGMAIVPEARRAGVGRAIMVQLLAEAKSRGDRTMVLEVIEQNHAAIELYRASGFQTIRRLIGFAGPDVVSGVSTRESSPITEVDLREVATAVTRYGLSDLPWQLSRETIAQLSPPAVGYRSGDTWIAITDPAQSVVTVRALVGPESASLLRPVMAKHPGKTEWRFNPVWPEELSETIAAAGLPRTSLSQFQMQRSV